MAALKADLAAQTYRGSALVTTEEVEEVLAATVWRDAANALLTALVPACPESGLFGVSAQGNQWKATIRYGQAAHNLGTFGTEEEAVRAYNKEALPRGKFWPQNYGGTEL